MATSTSLIPSISTVLRSSVFYDTSIRLATPVKDNVSLPKMEFKALQAILAKSYENSLKTNIDLVAALTRSRLNTIRQLDGRINITIYTLMCGGLGDFMYGVQLQKYLLDTVPNLNLRWILLYQGAKDLEIVERLLQGFQDLNSTIYFYDVLRLNIAKEKELSNLPPSLSIVCPTTCRPCIYTRFSIPTSQSILLGEISGSSNFKTEFAIHLKCGLSAYSGIGLPFKHPDYINSFPLNRCVGSTFLPKGKKFFFSYFYCKIAAENFVNWYTYIEVMMCLSPKSEKDTFFISNMKLDECVHQLLISSIEFSKKLSSQSKINKIIYLEKQKNDDFRKKIFVLNSKASRNICVINPFPLQNYEFYTYMKESHLIVGCTGDSSFTEAISLNKIPYYDSYCDIKNSALKNLYLYTDHFDMAYYLQDLERNKTNIKLLRDLLSIKEPMFRLDKIPNAYKVISQAILRGVSSR